VDEVVLNFNKSSIALINVTLAFIMFGIALDLSIDKFKTVLLTPKKLCAGLVSQLLLLPAFTFLLIILFKPQASVALGMILVASCPGGNISNFISSLAKANVELSISLTSITSVLSILFTPINFNIYGSMYEPANEILKEISLDWLEVIQTIGTIIIIPIIVGMLVKTKYPKIAQRLSKPLELISMLLFLLIVIGALISNLNYFMECVTAVFLLVLLHNGGALTIGYLSGLLTGLDFKDKKSLAIETGIQNSGLGLLIIFSFFNGLGGMAIITAWWGIWHIVSGFSLAYIWRKR